MKLAVFMQAYGHGSRGVCIIRKGGLNDQILMELAAHIAAVPYDEIVWEWQGDDIHAYVRDRRPYGDGKGEYLGFVTVLDAKYGEFLAI